MTLLSLWYFAAKELTLHRFDNTALVAPATTSSVVASLEAIPTCVAAGCAAPSSLLLTGRFAPLKAARFAFELSFDPPLVFPSTEAYARLWVDDHLLYPRNTTIGNGPCHAGPQWIVLPPDALDNDGIRVAPRSGAANLSQYDVRVEHVCLATGGCAARSMRIRYANYGAGDAIAPPTAPLRAVPSAQLLPDSSAPEAARRAMYTTMERGWGTFDRPSSLSWVLLPESLTVRLGLYQKSTGAYLPSVGITVHKPEGGTDAAPAPRFVLKAGVHAMDQSYAEASLAWRGLNVSFEGVVDGANNSRLGLVATVASGDASDFFLVVTAHFSHGRAGAPFVDTARGRVGGVGAGLRRSEVRVAQGALARFPPAPRNASVALPQAYVAVALSASAAVVLSSDDASSASAVLANAARMRGAELTKLAAYGAEWSDVKDAVQTVLMWSTCYSPLWGGFITPSFGYTDTAMAPTPITPDGTSGAVSGRLPFPRSLARAQVPHSCCGGEPTRESVQRAVARARPRSSPRSLAYARALPLSLRA